MKYTEVNGDLFTVPQGYYLAHCISADFALGAGIAKKFDEIYNMRFKLFRNFHSNERKTNWIGSALLIDNVFNLVTKPRYYQKPYYNDLHSALIDMREQCEKLNITKLAMPKIGAGLDKLEWERVRELIYDAFDESNIEILIMIL